MAEAGKSMGLGSELQGYGRYVLTASDATQFALEGDQVIGQTEHSLFTHHLIKGLEDGEADINSDGKITVDELYEYIYEQVARQTPNQTPMKFTTRQEGEIVLRHLVPEELLKAVENPAPDTRLAAVLRLAKLLNTKTPRQAQAVNKVLERITKEDDSRRVIIAAQAALESIDQIIPEEQPVRPSLGSVDVKQEAKQTDVQKLVEYANAKVVLAGDTGVGKSGLALVLTGQPFTATESTHGRQVSRFDITNVDLPNGRKQIRETILWDLAGQPGYRLIHQLDLQDVAVALIVFDARSETNPLSGVTHWVRALQQSNKGQGNSENSGSALIKFLVAARADRGHVNLSPEDIDRFLQKHGFQGFFKTSAKTGLNISELSKAIQDALAWDSLPSVSSNVLFERIRDFLNAEKKNKRILSKLDDLYRSFVLSQKEAEISEDLLDQFKVCIGRIEPLGIIRSLSFGDLLLLQPEILVSYASALINAVKSDPDGLGSISEARVRQGAFDVPEDERISDREQEKILMIAMIETLIKHEIALHEGSDLVFPTQLTRENPEPYDPDEETVIFRFEGPVQNIYATLVVRLSHSDIFGKKELWKNAATFTSIARGTCGISLIDHEDGRGEFRLFFDLAATEQTRLQFEEYVRKHIERSAKKETIDRERIFLCEECKTPVAPIVVARRRERNLNWLDCSVCDNRVSLLDGEERLSGRLVSRVDEIDESADASRRREINASILQGKKATRDFDVFLCHNSEDKSAVKEIGRLLMDHAILPWLDEWELRPGLPWQPLLEEQISKIKSAAVFVGSSGMGPWQLKEMYAFLNAFVVRGCPVIPVLLPTVRETPALPIFLQGMTWVDFRKQDPSPLERLIWGITGERIIV